MSFSTKSDEHFQWPSEFNHRTLPRDAIIKTLILSMSSGKVDRIQLELTSCEGQILSDEIGAVGIRSNMVIIHL